MRKSLKILLAATTLAVSGLAPSTASATVTPAQGPLSQAVTFAGLAGTVSNGGYSGAASFGIRTVHDHKRGDVKLTAFYFEVSRTTCDLSGCLTRSDVIYSPEADRRLTGRITVATDLHSATLAPTRLPVVHTRVHFGNDGSFHFSSTKTFDLVHGTARATGASRFERIVDPFGDAFLVISGDRRPAKTKLVIAGTTWRSDVGAGTSLSSTTSRLWAVPPS